MHAKSSRSPFAARATCAVALVLACVDHTAAAAPPAEWNFAVRLDGKPIGTHRFVLAGADDGSLALTSEAQFNVSVLGVPLYRYRHRVNERWTGGCLAAIEARTDDNGQLTEVLGQVLQGRFDLKVRGGGRSPPVAPPSGCVMSFAYWNPALSRQKQLLDPGSGRIETVVMATPSAIPGDLQSEAVRGLRISGLPQAIDVWYVGDHWVGLDTTVSDGRRLSYRLN
ncbi:MAG TPA: DUF6134 family protein [Burkholderiaceae bacterium]|nr:DUF6134 family protein [Burkholderiaceae bacterium]